MAFRVNRFFRRRYAPAWLTLVLGLTVSAGLGLRLHRQAVELDRLRLQRIAEVVLDRLQTKLQTTDLIMRHAQDYFGSQEGITDGMFQEWCRKYGWSITAPWMHGLALFTNLNAGGWRGVVRPDPAVWTKAEIRAFKEFAVRTPIALAFASGYCSDPTKRWPANYARQLQYGERDEGFVGAIPYNTPTTTARQSVIEQDGKAVYGATVAVPLYELKRDELHDLAASLSPKPDPRCFNWNLCRGVLLAPIDYVRLESVIWGEKPMEVGVEIFASPQPRLEAWLNPGEHLSRALDPVFKPYLTVNVPWKLYNGRWTLFVYTLPSFEAGSPRYMASLTLVAGTSMTLLATLLVGSALRARDRQERLTEQIREARDALTVAQQERERFSRDLHDGTIQSLYAIQLGLGRTVERLAAQPASARQELSVVRGELDTVITEIRQFITAEAVAEKPVDFRAVLHALVQRARAGTSAHIELLCETAASDRLTGEQAVQLANIAREALSNSLRHAAPRRVEIRLCTERETVVLDIGDDGAGFDPTAPGRPGVGLASMTARARELGAPLSLQSSPGKGTRILIRVPASPAEPTEPE